MMVINVSITIYQRDGRPISCCFDRSISIYVCHQIGLILAMRTQRNELPTADDTTTALE